ncbi:36995_t:CDS:2, partial [Gigaspora margarita]
ESDDEVGSSINTSDEVNKHSMYHIGMQIFHPMMIPVVITVYQATKMNYMEHVLIVMNSAPRTDDDPKKLIEGWTSEN